MRDDGGVGMTMVVWECFFFKRASTNPTRPAIDRPWYDDAQARTDAVAVALAAAGVLGAHRDLVHAPHQQAGACGAEAGLRRSSGRLSFD